MSKPTPNTITLPAFEGILTALQTFQEQQNSFADDMEKYVDGRLVTTLGTDFTAAVVDGLESCFEHGDPDGLNGGIIGWWLWDAPDAGQDPEAAWIEVNGTRHSLRTIPLLYEYLTTGKTSIVQQEANA